MGEPEAIRAILNGEITIDGKTYIIEKQDQGYCDGCFFHPKAEEPFRCPNKAVQICTTGGHILTEK